ncbi:unnamed protein product [Dicrocoelium dendriticum]|nr:unnamed protein product [Dicrocoelium dendriticum]
MLHGHCMIDHTEKSISVHYQKKSICGGTHCYGDKPAPVAFVLLLTECLLYSTRGISAEDSYLHKVYCFNISSHYVDSPTTSHNLTTIGLLEQWYSQALT